MHEVAVACGVGRQPERERGELQLLSGLPLERQQFAGLFRVRVARIADRQARQRRHPHRDRHLLRRIADGGAQCDRVARDLHDVAGDPQVGALGRDAAILAHGEDVIAWPDRVIARLEVGLRHGKAVDVFPFVIAFEDRLAVEQHVPRPAGVIHADLSHLDAIRRGDRVDDRPLPLQGVDRLGRVVERHEPQFDGVRRQRHEREEQCQNAEAGAKFRVGLAWKLHVSACR